MFAIQRGIRMTYLAWCYCELKDERFYYAYSAEMSVTEFAWRVSEKVGHGVLPAETIGIHREKELIGLRAEHI